jgi:hypothetical protein
VTAAVLNRPPTVASPPMEVPLEAPRELTGDAGVPGPREGTRSTKSSRWNLRTGQPVPGTAASRVAVSAGPRCPSRAATPEMASQRHWSHAAFGRDIRCHRLGGFASQRTRQDVLLRGHREVATPDPVLDWIDTRPETAGKSTPALPGPGDGGHSTEAAAVPPGTARSDDKAPAGRSE